MLARALEAAETDPDAPARAVAQLELERAKLALEDARKIASRRSGQRGFDARKALLAAEAALAEAENQCVRYSRLALLTREASATSPLSTSEDAAGKATTMLEEIQGRLDQVLNLFLNSTPS